MRHPLVRAGLLVQLILALSATWSAGAAAQPGAGPRETVDQPFTTAIPNSPTGLGYIGVYHAARNPRGNPPYMRRMVFFPPRGMRYDTCFPEPPTGQCLVRDYILQLRSSTFLPAYKKTVGGRVRSYATTPKSCPRTGYWRTTVRFWWAGGAVDSVASREPCRRPRSRRNH